MTAPENGEGIADEIRCDRCARPLRGVSRPDRAACRCTAEAIAAWRQAGRPGTVMHWLHNTPRLEAEERRVPTVEDVVREAERRRASLGLEPRSTETINLQAPRGWDARAAACGWTGTPPLPQARDTYRTFSPDEPIFHHPRETVEEQFDELDDCVKGLDLVIKGVCFIVGALAGALLTVGLA